MSLLVIDLRSEVDSMGILYGIWANAQWASLKITMNNGMIDRRIDPVKVVISLVEGCSGRF